MATTKWTATDTRTGQQLTNSRLGDLLFDVWRYWKHGTGLTRTARRSVRRDGRYSDGRIVITH